MWADLGIAGYWGNVFTSKLPAITPEETLKLFGAFGLTTVGCLIPASLMIEPIPPGIPLLRSSFGAPIDGGIAASFTCLIVLDILLGASNSVLSISTLAWTLGAPAAGGCAGGGDGATISEAIICLGSASGCNNGQITSASNAAALSKKATNDQNLFLRFILLPDSINESSNIASPRSITAYAYLDTGPDILSIAY
jgi:hypothetical protein